MDACKKIRFQPIGQTLAQAAALVAMAAAVLALLVIL
jgi:hypothetical protein